MAVVTGFALLTGLCGCTTAAQMSTVPVVSTSPSTTVPAGAPLVVLVVMDDVGWTSLSTGLSSLGHASDYHQTPALDALAAAGASFPHAYVSPNSSPTRAAIMSGRSPNRTKVYTADLANNAPEEDRLLDGTPTQRSLGINTVTIAEMLRDAGYRTGHFGKWDLGFDSDGKGPLSQGFDIKVAGDGDGMPSGGSDGNFAQADGSFAGVPGLGPNGIPFQFLADRLTDEALAFLAEDPATPAFVHMSHFSVHTPVQAPAEDLDFFAGVPLGAEHDHLEAAAMLWNMDRNIGRLVDYLSATDDPRAPGHTLMENTLFVVISDNGGQGGYAAEGFISDFDYISQAPLRSGKGSAYEGGIRVPLLVRWDRRIAPGSIVDAQVQHVDLYPTLAEAVGVEIGPENVQDGLSLMPVLDDPAASLERDMVFLHFGCYSGWQGSLHTPLRATPFSLAHAGPWKLWYLYETESWALYDLSVDLGETDDVAADNPQRVAEMGEALVQWLVETGADMPTYKGTNVAVPLPDPAVL
jgi:arylsulfatase A-like enzyme